MKHLHIVNKICVGVMVILAGGCGGGSEIRQQAATVESSVKVENTRKSEGTISVTSSAEKPGMISLRCENANIRDVAEKIAAHAGLKLQFDADVKDARCTISLENIKPVVAIVSIVESFDCDAVINDQTGKVIVKNKKPAATVVREAQPVSPQPPRASS
jgi:hypothetical protein